MSRRPRWAPLPVLLVLLAACSAPPAPPTPGAEYPPRLRAEIIALEERLRITPDDGAKAARLIALLRAAQLPERALTRGEDFLRAHPGQEGLPVHLALAELSGAAGDWQAAMLRVRAAGELTGDEIGTRLRLAAVAELSGDNDGALTLLEEAVVLAPGRAATRCARGDFRLRRGNAAEARTDYLAALESEPGSSAAILRLGLAAGTTGDLGETARCCHEVIQRENARTPLAGEAYLTLARIAFIAGTSAETREYLGRAASLLPERAEPLALLARLEVRQENHYGALELLNRAVALEPEYAPAYELQGDIMLRLTGLEEEALGCYRQAVALAPQQAGSRIKTAALLLRRGERDAARRELAAIRNPDPLAQEIISFNTAVLDALDGDTAAARAAFAAVRRDSPLADRARYNSARMALLAGDYAAAQAASFQLLADRASQPRTLNNLGVACALVGDEARARGLFIEALAVRDLPEISGNLRQAKGG